MAVLRSFQKQLIGAAVMGVAAFAASYASGGSLLIDGYGDFPGGGFFVSSGGSVTYDVTDTDILPTGTEVTVSVASAGVATIFAPVNGVLSLNTPTGFPAVYTFDYVMPDDDPVDFSAFPFFNLGVFDISDSVSLDFSLLLTDSDSNQALFDGGFTNMVGQTSGILSFFLSGFTFEDPGFDLGSISEFTITIEADPGNDFNIDELVAVPTPAAVGFGLAGLVLVAGRRRR